MCTLATRRAFCSASSSACIRSGTAFFASFRSVASSSANSCASAIRLSLWRAVVASGIPRRRWGVTASARHSSRKFSAVGVLTPRSQLDTAFVGVLNDFAEAFLGPFSLFAGIRYGPANVLGVFRVDASRHVHPYLYSRSIQSTSILGTRLMPNSARSAWPASPLARVPTELGAREMASRVRCLLLGEAHLEEPLLDLSAVCKAAGASVREKALSGEAGGQEALLTPLPNDRFAITVDATPRGGWRDEDSDLREHVRRHRVRFRIAHELGHTFFYWRRGNRPQRYLLDTPMQEHFCDTFAEALLVPSSVVERTPVNAAAIVHLQERFDVSLEVAARSLAAGHPEAHISLWFALTSGRDQLKLQWSNNSTDSTTLYDAATATITSEWLPHRRQLVLCRP